MLNVDGGTAHRESGSVDECNDRQQDDGRAGKRHKARRSGVEGTEV